MSPPDDADPDDLEEPPLTRDAVTPRGGFMARPGLKAPPRHAVVIRGGDVEPSETIPRARGSQPPPPKSELPTQLDLSPPGPVAPPLESLPPPSDMPVVASVPAPDFAQTRARRRSRSRWTVVAAAAAGILLGLASIAATRFQSERESTATAAPAVPAEVLAPAVPSLAPPPSASSEAPSPAAAPSRQVSGPPERARPGGSKRSIF